LFYSVICVQIRSFHIQYLWFFYSLWVTDLPWHCLKLIDSRNNLQFLSQINKQIYFINNLIYNVGDKGFEKVVMKIDTPCAEFLIEMSNMYVLWSSKHCAMITEDCTKSIVCSTKCRSGREQFKVGYIMFTSDLQHYNECPRNFSHISVGLSIDSAC